MQRRKISHNCTVFRSYCGKLACKAIGERSERHSDMNKVDHEEKFGNNRGRLDIG
jgi:hypothetical protein